MSDFLVLFVLDVLHDSLPMAFGLAGLIYLWLAVRAARATPQTGNSTIAYFLFLVGVMVVGSAFWYGANDLNMFGIGRVLTVFATGFMPIVLYSIYREYTVGRPGGYLLAALSIIPVATTVLAISNPFHGLLWSATPSDSGVQFSPVKEHLWFRLVQMPFAYGLFGYSIIALAGRLPTIARAHRGKVVLILACAVVPFGVNVANTVFEVGPANFPLTASTMVVFLPLYAWASVALRVHDFTPLAYQTLFDHVRDAIIVLDPAQRIISANQPAQDLLNADERTLIGQRLWEDLPEAKEILRHGGQQELSQTVRLQADRFFELNSAPLVGPYGEDRGMVVVCRDVTERKQTLRALADSEQLIRSLIEHSSNGILRFAKNLGADGRFRCTFANRAAERFLESGNGTLVGMPLEKLELLKPDRLLQRFGDLDSEGTPGTSYESEIEIDDGDCWLRVIAEPVGNDFSVTLIDITQRKRAETKMLADALRDPLTGVLNRRGFEETASAGIAKYEQGAVLYLDLNQFKSINDRFGHQAGDALLKAFGHRLEFCLRPEDILGRLGGDEFAIVLPGVSVEDAKHVAGRLVETASEAYIIQGEEIGCTASVGIALMPKHGKDLWHLVSVADQAMYNAKSISDEEAANDRAAYVEATIAS